MNSLRGTILRATLITVSICASIPSVSAYIDPTTAFGPLDAASSQSSSSPAGASSSALAGTSTSSYSSYPPSVPHGAADQQPPVTLIYSSPVSRRLLEEQVASREAEQRKNNAYYYSPQFTDPNYQPPVIASSAASVTVASSRPSIYDDNYAYEQRMKKLNANGQIVINFGTNGVTFDRNGNVLHSGAPNMTASGPADIVGASVLLLAAIGTLYTVWRENKKLRRRSR